MSLINNMLKELEKRENRYAPVPYILLPSSTKPIKKKLNKLAIVSLLLFFLFLFIAINLFSKDTHYQLKPFLAPSNTLTPISSINTQLSPALITGITLQLKDNITEMTLLLDHPVLYKLISHDLQNQLTLVLEKSQLQSALPAFNYLNTALQSLKVKNIDGDMYFVMTLNPESKLKYVTINNENKNPELVLGFEYEVITPSTNSTNNPDNPLIKTPALQSLLIQQYQMALSEIESGNYQAAIQNLNSLLKEEPNYKEARTSLIALLIDEGNIAKATHFVDQGLILNPDHLPFIELKARILAQSGKTQQALNLLQTASPALATNPEYHALIAALHARNNHDSLAVKIYKELVNLNPANGNWWFGLGASLDKLGQNRTAMAAYSHAITAGGLTPAAMKFLQKRLITLQGARDEKE